MQHRLDAHGVCAECGAPQFAIMNMHIACPLNDKQYKEMWQTISEKIDPAWYAAVKPYSDDVRKLAKAEKAKKRD